MHAPGKRVRVSLGNYPHVTLQAARAQANHILDEAKRGINPKLVNFEASCFDGKYITGDITADYLSHLAVERDEARGQAEADLLEEEKQPV